MAFLSIAYPEGAPRQDLHVVDVESGSARRLTQRGYALGPPGWSPDGGELALIDGAELVVIAADGSSRRTLLGGSDDTLLHPAWSSRDEIAYTKLHGATGAVHTIRPDGSGDRLLASVIAAPRAWSTDGESLLLDELAYPSTGHGRTSGLALYSVSLAPLSGLEPSSARQRR